MRGCVGPGALRARQGRQARGFLSVVRVETSRLLPGSPFVLPSSPPAHGEGVPRGPAGRKPGGEGAAERDPRCGQQSGAAHRAGAAAGGCFSSRPRSGCPLCPRPLLGLIWPYSHAYGSARESLTFPGARNEIEFRQPFVLSAVNRAEEVGWRLEENRSSKFVKCILSLIAFLGRRAVIWMVVSHLATVCLILTLFVVS